MKMSISKFVFILCTLANMASAQNRSAAFPIISMAMRGIDVPVLGVGHFMEHDWQSAGTFVISEGATFYLANKTVKIKLDTLAYPCTTTATTFYRRNLRGISPSSYTKYFLRNYSKMMLQSVKDIDLFLSYRNYRQDEVHQQPLSTASFWQLTMSPFKATYLREPEVFLPILGAATVSLLGYDESKTVFAAKKVNIYGHEFSSTGATLAHAMTNWLLFTAIAVSEEMVFRGMIQTELSERVNPDFGLVASSILFGLAHLPKHGWLYSLRALGAGFYLGWQYQKYDNDLSRVIAIHFHLDFLPTFIEFLKNPLTAPGTYRVTY